MHNSKRREGLPKSKQGLIKRSKDKMMKTRRKKMGLNLKKKILMRKMNRLRICQVLMILNCGKSESRKDRNVWRLWRLCSRCRTLLHEARL